MLISTVFLCKSVCPRCYYIPYFHVKNLQVLLVVVIYQMKYAENSIASHFLTLLSIMNTCNRSASVATTFCQLHAELELFSALCIW